MLSPPRPSSCKESHLTVSTKSQPSRSQPSYNPHGLNQVTTLTVSTKSQPSRSQPSHNPHGFNQVTTLTVSTKSQPSRSQPSHNPHGFNQVTTLTVSTKSQPSRSQPSHNGKLEMVFTHGGKTWVVLKCVAVRCAVKGGGRRRSGDPVSPPRAAEALPTRPPGHPRGGGGRGGRMGGGRRGRAGRCSWTLDCSLCLRQINQLIHWFFQFRPPLKRFSYIQ